MIRSIDFSRTLDSLRPFSVSLISPAVGRFTLYFHFNIRAVADLRHPRADEGAWFFALHDSLNAPLLRSRRVVASPNLLAIHQVNEAIPPGALRCEGPHDPGRRDLALGVCTLVYEEV